ncbi:hypothetical protein Poly24_43920 [Rosistilla carotiformis]|uniref:Uncharacterized protein n=1 Tax=Rosistilla carotiformis TaxID=2528017 RepID=A0A518JYP7_9BACT|nr:hypothetical protein Poly24_43920 [Rosistilla carotiformis]
MLRSPRGAVLTGAPRLRLKTFFSDQTDSANGAPLNLILICKSATRPTVPCYWLAMFQVRLQKSRGYCRPIKNRLHEGFCFVWLNGAMPAFQL